MFNNTFLDFDAVGPECINMRMNTQQARPCMCKDETNNALFARDTEAQLQSLVRLGHAQMCAQQFCRNWTETQEGGTNQTARVTMCSKWHVSARVIHSVSLIRRGTLGPTAV